MEETWTESRGPVAATIFDVEKAEIINAMLTRPIGILPSEPGEQIRPFAVGLFNEIRPLLRAEFGVTQLRRATAAYIYSKRYYFASAQPDAMRHDIDGNPVAPISQPDRLAAQKNFLKLKELFHRSDGEPRTSRVRPGQQA